MRFSPVARASASAASVLTVMIVAACSSDLSTSPSANNGTLVVQLTDAPFSTDSVKSVDVFVVRIDGRQADADSATAAKGTSDDSAGTGGWTTLAEPKSSINLLAYQKGASLAVGQKSLPAGSYSGFRLIIDPAQSSITLKNGQKLTATSNPGIMFPSAARSGIKILLSSPITVAKADTTKMLVDFDVNNSFVMRGNSISQNGLLFKPVIRATTTK